MHIATFWKEQYNEEQLRILNAHLYAMATAGTGCRQRDCGTFIREGMQNKDSYANIMKHLMSRENKKKYE